MDVREDVMKNLILTLLLAVAGTSAVQAQDYQPAVVRGSVLGAIAGAFIGGHNHDRWGQGAVIGAVAGGLIGAAVEQPAPPPRTVTYYAQPQPAAVVYAQPECPPPAPPAQVVYVSGPPPAQVVYVQSAPVVVARPVVYVVDSHGRRYARDYYRRW